ncbi:MAG: UDP-N-acetylglucosamine--N-acetylmuramyl-(pentapeptide) pyrophosphoryl-undecaprenol [Candidatus Saccharibacteria bacterium]|nr:UDP-N-acetylglucosamine--N-acetylmuramyl-(pentapeptide) pyrophosphoryl-undecaprenol [Candidatus Saccharibacteria bacterium]
MTGGGSGGHITPILAVAAELKKLQPGIKIIYIGQKGDALADVPAADPSIDQVYSVRAGKFRRYHGEGLRQLLDVPTLVKNMRDSLYVLIGMWQSWRLLRKLRPSVIFVKGGFVGVPVGLAAARLGIPYVTHDSDAIPGLANRIIAKWAALHTVALPREVYRYPKDKTLTVGIPLVAQYSLVTAAVKQQFREELSIPAQAKMLFIIGGGLGAQRINDAVVAVMPHLLAEFNDLYVVHGVGRNNETAVRTAYDASLNEVSNKRVQVHGFLGDVYRYSGAADVVITRAGATNLAEFAVQGKACIVIPSPFLTGGHQLKNAQYMADKNAAVILDEAAVQADPNYLARAVSELLKDAAKRQSLGQALQQFGHHDAAHKLAVVLLEQANK